MADRTDRQLELTFGENEETADQGSVTVRERREPVDQESRDAIRGELHINQMVLAGAGAGKTYELVERMVGTLADDRGDASIDIRNVAAITFTRKAAGELRTRFYDRLLKEARSATGDTSSRLKNAASRIDQCFIGTIHAFCSRLLRERPLEAGLPFDFKELDERDEPRARRRAWTNFTNARLREGDERLQRLLEIGFSAENLYEFFTRRNEFPELDLKPTDADEPDLRPAVQAVADLIARSEPLMTPEGRAKPGKWGELAIQAKEILEKRELATTADRAEFLTPFDSTTLQSGKGVKVTRYTDKEFAYQLRDQLVPDLKRRVIDPSLSAWRRYVYSLMGDLVDEAMRSYEEERRLAGVVTFSDLLIRAKEMLRRNPGVRDYFQQRYRRILVDEFQDTDPVQAEILFYLTGDDIHEADWRRLKPHPGSLFVVGDEKQSIYRFRRADVETFRFVRNRIQDTGGRVVSLNTSFRSLGNLCAWLNDTFEAIFAQEDPDYQAEYGRLLQYRSEGKDPTCVRKLTITEVGGRQAIVAAEADRIGDFVAACHAGESEFNGEGADAILSARPSYGSFMILAWTGTQVEAYARALESRGIPYDLVGGDLGRSDELEVVTSMLEAVADPKNPVPLIAYLRGQLVGLGDDELLAIRKSGRRYAYNVKDLGDLDAVTADRLRVAYDRLIRARKTLESLTPAAAVEQIITESGLIPWSASSEDFLGSSRAGNLLRLLANVRRWERRGLHWVEIVREMRALIDEDEFRIPGLTLDSSDENAVRVMNLHQAKGLQADVVFLADPTGFGRDDPPSFHVSRLGDHPYLSMAVLKPQRYGPPKTLAEPEGWADDGAVEARYLEAEITRLRYVAATRAKNLLVVSVAEGRRRRPWETLTPFLRDVPELERYPSARAPALKELETIYGEAVTLREERWNLASLPSWSVATASREGEDHILFLSGEQRGADYGSTVHQLLDDLVAERIADVRTYLASSTTLDEAAREAAEAAATGFKASNIWFEIERSSEKYTEVPYGAVVEADPVTLMRGRIDLVYRVESGWKIVDYKTDGAETDLEVQHLVEHYRHQVASYAEHWSRITGQPVVEKGLWLTALNRYVPLD